MRRRPRSATEPLFGTFLIYRTASVAVLMAAGAVGLFLWEYSAEVDRVGHDVALAEAQAMAVTTIVMFQIFYMLNCRSLRESIGNVGWFSNPAVYVGIGALLALQLGFDTCPSCRRFSALLPFRRGPSLFQYWSERLSSG